MFALALITLTTIWIALGAFAIVRARRMKRSCGGGVPGITVLKPLCGTDAGLESNLESFFTQDYATYQLVFGVENENDPALAVVERLRTRYPQADVAIVKSKGSRARNPKVSNLRAMLPSAKHDLLLISDSNVRAPRTYLAELAQTISADRVGLVTNIFSGTGEETFGAALENVQLNGFVAAGSAIPTMIGDAAVVGKSMFFSRTVLERLGGFESVSDVLAEDFILGKMFQHGGYRVVIGPTILESRNGAVSIARFLDRQLRWSMMRVRLRPLAFLLEPLASPIVMLPVAMIALGPVAAIVWALAMLFVRDVFQWIMLRGFSRVHLPLVLGVARDVASLGVWIATPFSSRISWRGKRVRLGAGTHVFVSDPALA